MSNTYFKCAREISMLSTFPRIRIGCVVVKGKSIISSGFNEERTHPIQLRYNKYRKERRKHDTSYIHAEMSAILSSPVHDLSNCEIYVYRESTDGCLLMARPCEACMKLIKERGVRVIHYSTPDGFATEKFERI